MGIGSGANCNSGALATVTAEPASKDEGCGRIKLI